MLHQLNRKSFLILGVFILIVAIFPSKNTVYELLLPVYAASIETFQNKYELIDLSIQTNRLGESVYVANMQLPRSELAHPEAFTSGIGVQSSTLCGHTFSIILLAIVLLFVSIISTDTNVRFSALLLTPIYMGVMLLDTPIVLFGALEDLFAQSVYSLKTTNYFSIWWMNMMNGGGRYVLTIAVTAIIILSAMNQVRRTPKTGYAG